MKTIYALVLILLTSTSVLAQQTATPAPAAPLNQDFMNMYVGPGAETMTDLNVAHRSVREISDWVSGVVTNSLQFQPGHTSDKLLQTKPNFSEAGYKAYLDFLASQPFAPALRAQSLKLTTIVNNSPLLIGQGASGGRYAWAFDLPVIMTPAGQGGINVPVNLRIQVGRNPNGPAPHNVIIENWQIRQENVQNPGTPAQQP